MHKQQKLALSGTDVDSLYFILENQSISNFQGLVTLILDRVKWHTVMHHSSTSTYTPNFTEIADRMKNVESHIWIFVHVQAHVTQKPRQI